MKNFYSIHQTSFLPYIGFWAKLHKSKIFFLDENDIFSRSSMYHRTFYTKMNNDIDFLTLPLDKQDCKLGEVTLTQPNKIGDKLITILQPYSNAKYYKQVKHFVKRIANEVDEIEYLKDINRKLLFEICDFLELETQIEIIKAHDIVYKSDSKTERLVEEIDYLTVKFPQLKDMTYISGGLGRNYIDSEKMKNDFVYQTSKSEYYTGNILYYMLHHDIDEIKSMMESIYTYET
jgi:hypothetical protein